jgi:hypothetical protein
VARQCLFIGADRKPPTSGQMALLTQLGHRSVEMLTAISR